MVLNPHRKLYSCVETAAAEKIITGYFLSRAFDRPVPVAWAISGDLKPHQANTTYKK